MQMRVEVPFLGSGSCAPPILKEMLEVVVLAVLLVFQPAVETVMFRPSRSGKLRDARGLVNATCFASPAVKLNGPTQLSSTLAVARATAMAIKATRVSNDVPMVVKSARVRREVRLLCACCAQTNLHFNKY
jgi:hypothetical protein